MRQKCGLTLLVGSLCVGNFSVMAADWRCGMDIIAAPDMETQISVEAKHAWKDLHLNIDAVDAFSASAFPGKSFRLADIAFAPEYENEAMAWLEKASADTVSVRVLADHADYLGRLPVDVHDPVTGDWRAGILNSGLAMLVPETGDDVTYLMGIEDSAIKGQVGIWSAQEAQTAYYVVANHVGDAEIPTARDAIGRFAVVDGIIRSIEHQEWRSYLNFGSNWREDFTIALDARARDMFARNGDVQSSFQSLIGQKVRVRGVIENRGGPYVALENPLWLCLSPQ